MKGDVTVINPLVVRGPLPVKGAGFRVALSTRRPGDNAKWHITPKEQAVSRFERDFPESAPPPDDIYPIIWDEKRGNVSDLSGVHDRQTLKERGGKMVIPKKPASRRRILLRFDNKDGPVTGLNRWLRESRGVR